MEKQFSYEEIVFNELTNKNFDKRILKELNLPEEN
jgi:hypothetical protein